MRSILKFTVERLALLMVQPAVLLYRLGTLIAGAEKVFPGWSQAFSLLPGLTGQYLRRAFYACVLKQCGNGTCLTFGTIISHPTASIGRNVYVGAFCSLGDVTLQDDVLVASNVSIMNGSRQHGIERTDTPIREQPGVFEPVTIGAGTWIGERATVAASVGQGCVIGAGSVVTRPLPDFAIALGVPARIIRFRNSSTAVSQDADDIVMDVLEQSRGLLTAAK